MLDGREMDCVTWSFLVRMSLSLVLFLVFLQTGLGRFGKRGGMKITRVEVRW